MAAPELELKTKLSAIKRSPGGVAYWIHVFMPAPELSNRKVRCVSLSKRREFTPQKTIRFVAGIYTGTVQNEYGYNLDP